MTYTIARAISGAETKPGESYYTFKDLKAAYAAGVAASKWQPIETAPKDGTTVLLNGFWAGEIHGPCKTPTIDIGCWGPGGDYEGFDWVLSTGDCYGCWMKATHWIGIPDAPKEYMSDLSALRGIQGVGL